MIAVSRCVVGAALLVAMASSSPRADAAEKLPGFVETVLPWLPADTETLLVAKEFTMDAGRGEDQQLQGLSLASMARVLSVSPLPGSMKKVLAGRRVRWAVHGGRNFDVVSSFGFYRQEGASVIRFDAKLPEDTAKQLRNHLRAEAKEVRRLAGHETFALPPDRQGMEPSVKVKPWQGRFVVLLRPDTIITATSDAYLTTLLTRIDNKPGARALPNDLPEWKHVDTSADAWLLRHLPSKGPQAERHAGPQRLRGLVWMIRAKQRPTYRAIYLPMPGQRVDDIAHRPWRMPDEEKIPKELAAILDFQTAPDGTVTFTFPKPIKQDGKVDLEQTKKQLEKLTDSPGKSRLLVFVLFHLHRTQGVWR